MQADVSYSLYICSSSRVLFFRWNGTDIPSISGIVATAVGATVGVVLDYLEIRNSVVARQTEIAIRLYSAGGSEDILKAGVSAWTLECKDYDDFVKKYGSWSVEKRATKFPPQAIKVN